MKNIFRAVSLCALLAIPAMAADTKILALKIEGMINPVIGDYVKDGLARAKEENAAAILIELDTPGGLLDTTRSIVQSFLNSEIPIIVYVSPRGARATSAGVFITMAADIAAMAPETHLGAAHPVNIGGETPDLPSKTSSQKKEKPTGSVMDEKMVSDAAAYIRSIATDKARNAEWAEKAVRESVSLTAEEALKEKVIEHVAPSREELLKIIDGKQIKKNGRTITLKSAGAVVIDDPMSQFRKWLQIIAHPNVAYVLMTIGIYGLIYELASPGIGLGGAVGVVCLLLAFFSLQVLPVTALGLALIALGAVLLALELFTPTHGLLTFAGLAAFAAGSFFLIDVKESPDIGRISIELIAGTVATTAFFFGWGLKKVLAAKRMKPKTGADGLIGLAGETQTDLTPEGMVFVNGELWSAAAGETIAKGARVVVKKVEGNKIYVEKN